MALQPGETQTVTVPLDFRAFAFYHPGFRRWITEDGEFDILIGASSADIRCVETVTLKSTVEFPCTLSRESTVRDWLEDPRGKFALEPFLQQLAGPLAATFGGVDGEGGAFDLEAVDFAMDMPLPNLFEFLGDGFQASPDEVMDGLLRHAHA